MVSVIRWFTDLTDHDGERKDANKVVDELEADLEDRGGVRQSSNGNQRLHGKVVTADVTAGTQTRMRYLLKGLPPVGDYLTFASSFLLSFSCPLAQTNTTS